MELSNLVMVDTEILQNMRILSTIDADPFLLAVQEFTAVNPAVFDRFLQN